MQREAGDEIAPSRVASFHLVREPVWRAPLALGRLGTDRLRLRGTPGLRFARLLGTGSGAAATVNDLGLVVEFAAGEEVRTEISAKFRIAGLAVELADAGLAPQRTWVDPLERFALVLAEAV